MAREMGCNAVAAPVEFQAKVSRIMHNNLKLWANHCLQKPFAKNQSKYESINQASQYKRGIEGNNRVT